MHGFIMACIVMLDTGQNSLPCWKLATCFKKIPHTLPKTRWSKCQFQKGQPTPCKTWDNFSHSSLG